MVPILSLIVYLSVSIQVFYSVYGFCGVQLYIGLDALYHANIGADSVVGRFLRDAADLLQTRFLVRVCISSFVTYVPISSLALKAHF